MKALLICAALVGSIGLAACEDTYGYDGPRYYDRGYGYHHDRGDYYRDRDYGRDRGYDRDNRDYDYPDR